MWRLFKDHQKAFEMVNYKIFLTLAEVIYAVLNSDEDEHEIVRIPPEQGNGNVTDEEEGDVNNVANSANTVLPNAGTLEVHKKSDGDGDGIIKNSERKLK